MSKFLFLLSVLDHSSNLGRIAISGVSQYCQAYLLSVPAETGSQFVQPVLQSESLQEQKKHTYSFNQHPKSPLFILKDLQILSKIWI